MASGSPVFGHSFLHLVVERQRIGRNVHREPEATLTAALRNTSLFTGPLIAGGGSGRETIHHVSPARTYQRLQTISSSIFSGQERRYGKRKKSFVTNHPPTLVPWVAPTSRVGGGWSFAVAHPLGTRVPMSRVRGSTEGGFSFRPQISCKDCWDGKATCRSPEKPQLKTLQRCHLPSA